MENKIRFYLSVILDILGRIDNSFGKEIISDILSTDNDSIEFWDKVTGNNIWGGSGSFIDIPFTDFDFENRDSNELNTYSIFIEFYLQSIAYNIKLSGKSTPRLENILKGPIYSGGFSRGYRRWINKNNLHNIVFRDQ